MWLLEIFKGREERPLGISFDQTNCVSKNFRNWPLKNAADLRGYHSYLLSLLEITGGVAELVIGILLIQSIALYTTTAFSFC